MKVKETKKLIIMDIEIDKAISLNNCPISELRNKMGKKTAKVVIVLARIAPATSFAPSIAAFLGSLTPLSNFEKIFSNTTNELSTTMPTAKLIPARLIKFNVLPINSNIMKELTVLMGIASAIIKVVFIDFKKKSKTNIASKAPKKRFCLTDEIDASI